MVQLDIPAAFAVSQFFLDVARPAIPQEAQPDGDLPTIYWRLLSLSLLFAGAVIAPAGIYLLAGWPGWEQIYWVQFVENVVFNGLNALAFPAFIIAIVLAGYVGHRVGYWLLTTGRQKWLRPMYITVLAIPTLVVAACYPAFTLVGTYEQYHNDRSAMALAWTNPHDFSVAWVGVIVFFIVMLIAFTLHVRKIAAAHKTSKETA